MSENSQENTCEFFKFFYRTTSGNCFWRKHKEVTVQTKYEALQELEKRRLEKDLVNKFDIPR